MAKDAVRAALEQFGLTEKEAQLYLLLLQLGTVAASSLADRAGIARSTAQFTCQQLVRRGVLQMVEKGNTYLFTAESPEKLTMLLRRQMVDLEEKEDRMQRVMGELKAMKNPYTILPRVQFFEGKEGVERAYNSVLDELDEGETIRSFVKVLSQEDDGIAFRPELTRFMQMRVKKNVHSRLIAPATPASMTLRQTDHETLRETRLVPPEYFQLVSAEIIIYKDKVYSMAFENNALFATITQNQSLATMQKAIFELAWERAGETTEVLLSSLKKAS